jgi:hypothetical protein
MDPESLLSFLIDNARLWGRAQRDLYRSSARLSSQEERSALSGFFDLEILDKARVITVAVIGNPSFYSDLEQMGLSVPLNFTTTTGITYHDTILVSQARFPLPSHWTSLLFHELVHAVQYDLLGVDEFMDHYVRGWAQKGFNYYWIPLERDAYGKPEMGRKVAAPKKTEGPTRGGVAIVFGILNVAIGLITLGIPSWFDVLGYADNVVWAGTLGIPALGVVLVGKVFS